MTDKECFEKVAKLITGYGDKDSNPTYMINSPVGEAMDLMQKQTGSKEIAKIQKLDGLP